MVRFGGILFGAGLLASTTALTQSALAQCRGGAGQGATQGTTGTAPAAGILAGTTGLNGGAALLSGPGSLAYDLMAQQMFARQMAQRQMLMAMQQQQMKQEKLAARKHRAEQTRTQVAESRARTRAALAAKNGPTLARPAQGPLVAYQPMRH